MLTRVQKFALDAEKRVRSAQDSVKNPRRYGSLAHKLPVLIRTSGLVQALAFVEARGKDEGKQLLEDLAITIGIEGENRATQLVKRSRNATMLEYMRLTRLTLDALLWYKRFAQSILNIDAGDEEES